MPIIEKEQQKSEGLQKLKNFIWERENEWMNYQSWLEYHPDFFTAYSYQQILVSFMTMQL